MFVLYNSHFFLPCIDAVSIWHLKEVPKFYQPANAVLFQSYSLDTCTLLAFTTSHSQNRYPFFDGKHVQFVIAD